MRNPYESVIKIKYLENWKSEIYDDCRYYNDCSICPHRNEDTECDLILITRRIALLEKAENDNKEKDNGRSNDV